MVVGDVKMASSSSSSANQSQVPTFYYYPPALAMYKDVVASPQLFMDTLGKLHAAMATKFMIPIIGGKDLDLHRLFVEVTSRGGIKKVLGEKKWKEVTTCFSFPPSATNASFILRKYYMSLLHHYEQVYYFEAKAWTPVSTDAWQNMHSVPISAHVLDPIQPSAEIQAAPVKHHRLPSAEMANPIKRSRIDAVETSVGCSVTGIIDGKFESGYLVTVKIGSEQLRGVLYQTPNDVACQVTRQQYQSANKNARDPTNAMSASGVTRRRRRKKSEMKKRDPAHPKPNRSGYNFFFAEQHARLKPLHPGKDRDISRMIGELWNNINESQRAVYQEKALRDKERYKMEMLHYKENQRVGQIFSNVVPVQQQPPLDLDVNVGEVDENLDVGDGGSPQILENELTFGQSDRSNSEEEEEEEGDDETADNGTETERVNNLESLFEMEKSDLIKIQEGGLDEEEEEEEDSPTVREKKSATPEDEVKKESVALTIIDETETELTSDDLMKKRSNLETEKEPASLELVQEESVNANMERAGNEDVGGLPFDREEKDLVVDSKVNECLTS